MTPKELYEKLSEKIPTSLSCDWDNDGLSVVSSEKNVKRVLVTLDITKGAVDHAVKKGFDCIVSHHPLLFHPLKALDPDSPSARKAMILFKNGVSAMSFHTRLDAAKNGVNDALAEKLGLSGVIPFAETGRIGVLPEKMKLPDFVSLVKEKLGCVSVRYSGSRKAYKVAVVGGSGDDFTGAAKNCGADTFLTGEGHHNSFADVPESGMNYIVAGHFETEDPVCRSLIKFIKETDPAIECEYYCSNVIKTV